VGTTPGNRVAGITTRPSTQVPVGTSDATHVTVSVPTATLPLSSSLSSVVTMTKANLPDISPLLVTETLIGAHLAGSNRELRPTITEIMPMMKVTKWAIQLGRPSG